MATSAVIAKKKADGKYRCVYCHWDGYPSNVGVVLNLCYTEENKVNKLMSLNSLSQLGESPTIVPTESDMGLGTFRGKFKACIAHERDMGLDAPKCVVQRIEDIPYWYSYLYIWENGSWNTYEVNDNGLEKMKIDYKQDIENYKSYREKCKQELKS